MRRDDKSLDHLRFEHIACPYRAKAGNIAQLADRLRGGTGIVAPWPTDDPGLSRAERRELQTLLLAKGHAIGKVDGVLGASSRGDRAGTATPWAVAGRWTGRAEAAAGVADWPLKTGACRR